MKSYKVRQWEKAFNKTATAEDVIRIDEPSDYDISNEYVAPTSRPPRKVEVVRKVQTVGKGIYGSVSKKPKNVTVNVPTEFVAITGVSKDPKIIRDPRVIKYAKISCTNEGIIVAIIEIMNKYQSKSYGITVGISGFNEFATVMRNRNSKSIPRINEIYRAIDDMMD